VNRDHFCFGEKKRQAFREEYGIGDDEEVVLTVAQLTPRKGLYDFLALAKECPEKKWIWVGGLPYGAMSKNYRRIKKIKRHPAENVIFTGHIADISHAYSGADVFFLPSYAETFGLVILEALSCGLPVIARDIPEYYGIFDGQILFFEDNDDVIRLLDETGLLRQKAASARDFSARYDIRSVAAQHLAAGRGTMISVVIPLTTVGEHRRVSPRSNQTIEGGRSSWWTAGRRCGLRAAAGPRTSSSC
jgi:glycosyltransferase involved in cell wall biosynthesis